MHEVKHSAFIPLGFNFIKVCARPAPRPRPRRDIPDGEANVVLMFLHGVTLFSAPAHPHATSCGRV